MWQCACIDFARDDDRHCCVFGVYSAVLVGVSLIESIRVELRRAEETYEQDRSDAGGVVFVVGACVARGTMHKHRADVRACKVRAAPACATLKIAHNYVNVLKEHPPKRTHTNAAAYIRTFAYRSGDDDANALTHKHLMNSISLRTQHNIRTQSTTSPYTTGAM